MIQYVANTWVDICGAVYKKEKLILKKGVIATARIVDPQPAVPAGVSTIEEPVTAGMYLLLSCEDVRYTTNTKKSICECQNWKNYLTQDWTPYEDADDAEYTVQDLFEYKEDVLVFNQLLQPHAAVAPRRGPVNHSTSSKSKAAPGGKKAKHRKEVKRMTPKPVKYLKGFIYCLHSFNTNPKLHLFTC